MDDPVAGTATALEWAVATLTLPGQRASGDLHLVRPANGGDLVAVVDGLGHGEDAADAARIAVATLARYASEPMPSLMQRCHEALIGTRGVVMSLAVIDPALNQMTWFGIGNVEGLLMRVDWGERSARTTLVPRAGILGSRPDYSRARPQVMSLHRGDLLVLATDGIQSDFGDAVSLRDPPQVIADQVLSRYGKGTDDALVLVARYLGRR
jgi:phosphoserine phosphatase RsbX